MKPSFRKATPVDAPAMAQLIVLAWQKAYRGILSDELLDNRSTESGTRRIRDGIENKPEFQYYVLEHERRIAGVSVVCPSSDDDMPDAAAIQVFYIHPELQRQGLGRVLMRHTLDSIQAVTMQPVILWVFKDNHSARAFYETMGFVADGKEQTTEHLENAVSVRYRYKRGEAGMKNFSILLFEGFETLDAMGPAEIIGELPDAFKLHFCSLKGGIVTSAQGLRVDTVPASEVPAGDILLIPGGIGTRTLIQNKQALDTIKEFAQASEYVLTVCTGSLLLGKTGLLDGREATTNKKLFALVAGVNPNVRWRRQARWVTDGKYYTSSGVTAGMDMVLGFVSDTLGQNAAKAAAHTMEYIWNEDKTLDPFA